MNIDQVAEQARKILDHKAEGDRRFGSHFLEWPDLSPKRRDGWRALVQHVAAEALSEVADEVTQLRKENAELKASTALKQRLSMSDEIAALRAKVTQLESERLVNIGPGRYATAALRGIVGATEDESTGSAAARVVKERDDARANASQVESYRAAVLRAQDKEAGARNLLDARIGETLLDAASRVVKERDQLRGNGAQPDFAEIECMMLLRASACMMAEEQAAREDAEARLTMAQRTIERQATALKEIRKTAEQAHAPMFVVERRVIQVDPPYHRREKSPWSPFGYRWVPRLCDGRAR